MPIITPPPSTNTFTGSPIYPSQISGLIVALNSNTRFSWPFAPGNNPYPLASILEVYTDISTTMPPPTGWQIILPPANEASPFQSCFIRNVGATPATQGNYPIQVMDNSGNLIVTIPSWPVSGALAANSIYLYLTSTINPDGTSSTAGTWSYIWMGIGLTTDIAIQLAGAGLKAIGTTLNENILISKRSNTGTSPFTTIVASDRATFIIWQGTADQSVQLPDVTSSDIGDGFVVSIANQGVFTELKLFPYSNSGVSPAIQQTINGSSKPFPLAYGMSISLFADGLQGWYVLSGIAESSTRLSNVNIALPNL